MCYKYENACHLSKTYHDKNVWTPLERIMLWIHSGYIKHIIEANFIVPVKSTATVQFHAQYVLRPTTLRFLPLSAASWNHSIAKSRFTKRTRINKKILPGPRREAYSGLTLNADISLH